MNSQPGLQIGWPICPQCRARLQDPAAGTDVSDDYCLRCECGSWIDVERRVRVGFTVRRWSPTVPPWVFGLEEERAVSVAPPASSGVLPPYAEPEMDEEEKFPQGSKKIPPRDRKNSPKGSKKFP